MADVFTKEKRSEVMSKIRYKDTKIEIMLRKAIYEAGCRGYRLNYKLLGKPDIVFTKYKVAIFCDGEFWHGRYFNEKKHKYKKYWKDKIMYNMGRDRKNNEKLKSMGWLVMRFWETDIKKNMDKCTNEIESALKNRGYVHKPK
jgi:DNA mismatch endonuclease, patch repair protein